MGWMQLLFFVGAALLIWILYRQVRSNPEMFSKANLGKSIFTMGLLALGLIVFIGLLMMLARG